MKIKAQNLILWLSDYVATYELALYSCLVCHLSCLMGGPTLKIREATAGGPSGTV
jgi:hypothetical protein